MFINISWSLLVMKESDYTRT